ncbi:MAG: helix-turn-helix transcriptional regulator [Candidatus Gastranaerophilales bacterium]
MKLREKFGQRLEELLTKKNIKQCELAEKLDIDPQSISRMVAGKHFPKEENIEKISYALGVNESDLFTFVHIGTKAEIVDKINSKLVQANDEKLRMLYRLVEVVLE